MVVEGGFPKKGVDGNTKRKRNMNKQDQSHCAAVKRQFRKEGSQRAKKKKGAH